MRSDGPTRWLDYYHMHAILCAGYFTSRCILHIMLHTTNIKATCQVHFIARSWVRSDVHSWLHSIAHSQPAWLYPPNSSWWQIPSLLEIRSQVSFQDAPKYTPSTLPSPPPSTFSSTLPGMLSRTLPIAFQGTLPACLTAHSQLSPQDALKHTTKHIPNSLPIALDGKLPACLTVCSEVRCQGTLKHTR